MRGLGKKSLSILFLLYKRLEDDIPYVEFAEIVKHIGSTPQATSNIIRKLMELGYVRKVTFGVYIITDEGKKFVEEKLCITH